MSAQKHQDGNLTYIDFFGKGEIVRIGFREHSTAPHSFSRSENRR